MMKIELITKTQHMARTLLEIYDSANHLHGDDGAPGDEEHFYEIADTHDILFAMENNRPIAFLSTTSARKYIFISANYVHKDFQNKGIASQLMNELKTRNPGSVIWCKLLNYAPWAIKFYTKHGLSFIPQDSPLDSELGNPTKDEPWCALYATS